MFWRCQEVDAVTQVSKFGTCVCDIRVIHKRGGWRLCHGAVCFGPEFASLVDLIRWCMRFGFKYYRLIGRGSDKAGFYNEFLSLPTEVECCCISCIWQPDWTVYLSCDAMTISEHNKHMWYQDWPLLKNISNFLWPTIRDYAADNNHPHPEEAVPMYDYVNLMNA